MNVRRAWAAAFLVALATSCSVAALLAPIVHERPYLLRLPGGAFFGLLVLLPMLAIPPAIALPRTRAHALAITTVAALASLYPLGITAFFYFAFSGPGLPVALCVLVVALLPLAIAAYVALPSAQRSSGHWVVAIVFVAVYGIVARAAFVEMTSQIDTNVTTVNHNDLAAQTALTEIARCAKAHRAEHGGYPRQIDDMVGSGCLTSSVLDAGRAGHALEFIAGVDDPRDHVTIFAAAATPLQIGISGWQTAFIDDTAALVTGQPKIPGVALNPADLFGSAASWGRRVRWCALRAIGPDGYPLDLDAIRAHDPACLPPQTTTRVWLADSTGSVSYVTYPSQTSRRFAITARDTSGSAGNSYYDSDGRSGAIGAFAPGRPASGTSSIEPRPDPTDSATATELDERCAAGDASYCLQLGRGASVGTTDISLDDTRAASSFDRACTLGLAAGCVELAIHLTVRQSRGAPANVRRENTTRAAALFLHACDLGDGSGCERAAYDALRDKTPDDLMHALALFERGCDLSDQASCTRLSHVVLGDDEIFADMSNPDLQRRVSTRLRALCDGADAASCYLLARILSRPGAPSANLLEAQQLFFAACDAWPDYGCVDAAQLRLVQDGEPSPTTLEIAERGRCTPPVSTLPACGFVRTDYTQRCDAGDAEACFALALQFLRDDLDRAPPNDGWRSIERACTLGHAQACEMQRSVSERR